MYYLTRKLAYSLTHSLANSRTHSLTHSRTQIISQSHTHVFAQILTNVISHSCIISLANSRTDSISHSRTCPVTHLLSHPQTQHSVNCAFCTSIHSQLQSNQQDTHIHISHSLTAAIQPTGYTYSNIALTHNNVHITLTFTQILSDGQLQRFIIVLCIHSPINQ